MVPPFWGLPVTEASLEAVIPFLNEQGLCRFQWYFRKQGKSPEHLLGCAKGQLSPVMQQIFGICETDNILKPRAIYSYWKAARQDNGLIVIKQDGQTALCRFSLPWQSKEDGECIAGFSGTSTMQSGT